MLHKFMYAYGILPKDHFVEKNGLELKGRYVGHTAPNVKSAVADAMGGCLFLDEAYALVDSGGDSFSDLRIMRLRPVRGEAASDCGTPALGSPRHRRRPRFPQHGHVAPWRALMRSRA